MALWDLPKELHSNPLFIASLLFLSVALLLIRNVRSRGKSNLPPSPPRLPVIGNLHQLGALPHRSLGALSDKHGPLMLLKLGQSPTLVVSSSDMLKEITKTHDVAFSDRPQPTAAKLLLYDCQDVGFAPYGEYWRQARKLLVLEILSLKRVQQFQFVRDEEVSLLVDRVRRASRSNEGLNLSRAMFETSNNIMSMCILGRRIEDESGGIARDLSKRVMQQLVAFSVADFFPCLRWIDVARGFIPRLKAISKEFDKFFEEVIEEHKGRDNRVLSDGKDFVDIILAAKRDGLLEFDLTSERLKGILMDLFVGASDTTSAALEWLMAELMRHPRVMKKAQEEVRRVIGNKMKIDADDINKMDYLKCVIKETLRLHPPFPLLVARKTSKSVEVGGYNVPVNVDVFINAWKIQQSSSLWEKPEDFRPERFENKPVDFIKLGQDFSFVSFGIGRRGCPGILFGVASMEFVSANLLYWFDWKLSMDGHELVQELDMSEVNGLTVQKKLPLNLFPISHFPA